VLQLYLLDIYIRSYIIRYYYDIITILYHIITYTYILPCLVLYLRIMYGIVIISFI